MNLSSTWLDRKNLSVITGYLFVIQFLLFIGFLVLLPGNVQFLQSSSTIIMPDFLNELSQHANGFFILKSILIALRTCYGISFVFLAILFWQENKIAAAALISFSLLSVAIINIAQLMGIALIPLAQEYSHAKLHGDQIAMAALEASAFGIYTVQDYLDIFVIAVTFNGFFACLFAISYKEPGLTNIKWLIPIMMILPFNRVLDLPAIINAGASLTNVIVTAFFFLLMGRFFLRMDQVG